MKAVSKVTLCGRVAKSSFDRIVYFPQLFGINDAGARAGLDAVRELSGHQREQVGLNQGGAQLVLTHDRDAAGR